MLIQLIAQNRLPTHAAPHRATLVSNILACGRIREPKCILTIVNRCTIKCFYLVINIILLGIICITYNLFLHKFNRWKGFIQSLLKVI